MSGMANLISDHKLLTKEVGAQLEGTMPPVVVLDTLNKSLQGSESKDTDMANYIRAAEAIREAFQCVVIIVHQSLPEFQAQRHELEKRDFPTPDETTGRYCIEAVDRWRLRGHVRLFPELTTVAGAVDARTVVEDRLAAMRKGQR
jgi:hypothetical protein